MKKPKTVIKKYGDRRLYDSAASRYVKLDDIARMIRDGLDVEVLDARTGKDLTRVVLTQIVIEDARGHEAGLPLQLLRQLVVASDRATHEFVSWYLNGTFELYKKAQERFSSRLSQARLAVPNPLDFVRRLLEPKEEETEVQQLRRRVSELEAQLAGRPKRRRPAKTARVS